MFALECLVRPQGIMVCGFCFDSCVLDVSPIGASLVFLVCKGRVLVGVRAFWMFRCLKRRLRAWFFFTMWYPK